jgi:hypothetical protein
VRVLLVLAAFAACQRQDAEPAAGSGSDRDCAIVVTRVREAVQSQIESVGSDARITIAQMIPAMGDACLQDHWPVNLVHCIVAAKPGDLAALTQCNTLMSKDIQDKLQQRLMQRRHATP